MDEDSSSLQDYISQGDNRNARLHTQIVATRLNALSSGDDDTGGGDGDGGFSGAPTGDGGGGDGDITSLRKKIRRAMLSALKDLPLRDEVRTVDAPTVRHLRMYCSAAVAADIHTCICKKVRAVYMYMHSEQQMTSLRAEPEYFLHLYMYVYFGCQLHGCAHDYFTRSHYAISPC